MFQFWCVVDKKYIRQVRLKHYDHGTPLAEIARVVNISEADVAMYL